MVMASQSSRLSNANLEEPQVTQRGHSDTRFIGLSAHMEACNRAERLSELFPKDTDWLVHVQVVSARCLLQSSLAGPRLLLLPSWDCLVCHSGDIDRTFKMAGPMHASARLLILVRKPR